MLENTTVQISLKDFDVLRAESNQLRTLKKQLGSCCNVDFNKYNKSKSNNDIEININGKKLADVIKRCASFDIEVPQGESKSQRESEILYAKVNYK